ncbi:hypothetical protein HDU96_000113 [Phlyctochytrium bullatum]|nr:hypothetical protein HDU96_000113 [Phlyctochytrium bullatum]
MSLLAVGSQPRIEVQAVGLTLHHGGIANPDPHPIHIPHALDSKPHPLDIQDPSSIDIVPAVPSRHVLHTRQQTTPKQPLKSYADNGRFRCATDSASRLWCSTVEDGSTWTNMDRAASFVLLYGSDQLAIVGDYGSAFLGNLSLTTPINWTQAVGSSNIAQLGWSVPTARLWLRGRKGGLWMWENRPNQFRMDKLAGGLHAMDILGDRLHAVRYDNVVCARSVRAADWVCAPAKTPSKGFTASMVAATRTGLFVMDNKGALFVGSMPLGGGTVFSETGYVARGARQVARKEGTDTVFVIKSDGTVDFDVCGIKGVNCTTLPPLTLSKTTTSLSRTSARSTSSTVKTSTTTSSSTGAARSGTSVPLPSTKVTRGSTTTSTKVTTTSTKVSSLRTTTTTRRSSSSSSRISSTTTSQTRSSTSTTSQSLPSSTLSGSSSSLTSDTLSSSTLSSGTISSSTLSSDTLSSSSTLSTTSTNSTATSSISSSISTPTSCPDGQQLCNNQCISALRVCCNNMACDIGNICTPDNKCRPLCANAPGKYCPDGSVCGKDLKCYPNTCPDGSYCPDGYLCSPDNKCYPACPDGKTFCTRGICGPNNQCQLHICPPTVPGTPPAKTCTPGQMCNPKDLSCNSPCPDGVSFCAQGICNAKNVCVITNCNGGLGCKQNQVCGGDGKCYAECGKGKHCPEGYRCGAKEKCVPASQPACPPCGVGSVCGPEGACVKLCADGVHFCPTGYRCTPKMTCIQAVFPSLYATTRGPSATATFGFVEHEHDR